MVPNCGFDLHFSDNEWYWATFHVFVSHLYVFFGEMSVQFFGLFFDWIICFSGIELRKLLVHFWDSFFVSCFICYCFLPFEECEKRTFIYYWWECKLVQPLWKAVWNFLQKLKIELPYGLALLILYIYLGKKKKKLIQKDTWTPVFTAALFTVVKVWKQPIYIHQWING